MKRIVHVVVYRPKLLLFLIFVLTAFFAFHACQIRTVSSIESLLPQGDPQKQYYDEVRQLFGSDDLAIIGLVADDIYTPPVLEKVTRLTDEFRKIHEVKSVSSLANAPDILAGVTGEGQALLMPEIPPTTED